MNLGRFFDGIQRWVDRLATRRQQQFPYDTTAPYRDPSLTGTGHKFDLSTDIQFGYGVVNEALGFLGWYRVQPEGGRPSLACCLLADAGVAPTGVRRVGHLPVNTPVYYLQHPRAPYGCIIGAEAPPAFGLNERISEIISQCSRGGFAVDSAHSFLLQLQNHRLIDFSSGAPLDGTTAGEHGRLAETGVGYFVDPWMAFLRADENCGVWAFYIDQLLRLHGHNLEIRSILEEELHQDDRRELNKLSGLSVYDYEALGFWFPGSSQFRSFTSRQLLDTPHYGHREPLFDDQEPFRRILRHDGYLGQGGRRSVCLPPRSPSGPNRLSSTHDFPGVFDESIGLDGSYSLRSAREVSISKSTLFAVPAKVKLPPDPSGDGDPDGEGNYKPSGLYDNGPDHHIESAPTRPGDLPPYGHAADLEAYQNIWKADHPFHYHMRDYRLPEPQAVVQEAVPSYGSLDGLQDLPPPSSSLWKVDERYSARYFSVASAIRLYEDGSIVIRAGCGSEIRIANGNIELNAPGDVSLHPGRNAILWGGRDVVIRSRGDLDLSATNGTARLKAGQNLQLLADRGGVLIESKSEGLVSDFANKVGSDVAIGGVLIKAANSGVVAWGGEIYLAALTSGSATITFDAAGGVGNVVTNAHNDIRFLLEGAVDYFGLQGEIRGVNRYTDTTVTLCGSLTAQTSFVVNGPAVFGGPIAIVNGGVSDDQFNPLIGQLTDRDQEEIHRVLDTLTQELQDAATAGRDVYLGLLGEPYYADGRPGDPLVVQQAGFSFRTTAQCGTGSFRIIEARWQQQARLTGQSLESWTEQGVTAGGQVTYPWPGREAWLEGDNLIEVDPVLYDYRQGSAVPRSGGAYESPSLNAPSGKPLDGQYLVIGQATQQTSLRST